MSDVIKRIEKWLETEPNQTEVIILRKESNGFEVTLQYGNRTTVPRTADSLEEALLSAVSKAEKLPSLKRDTAEKKTLVDKTKAVAFKLPGM